MTIEQACAAVLGKNAAEAIIDDQGLAWCAVAAIAAAKTSDPEPALKALRGYLYQQRNIR